MTLQEDDSNATKYIEILLPFMCTTYMDKYPSSNYMEIKICGEEETRLN